MEQDRGWPVVAKQKLHQVVQSARRVVGDGRVALLNDGGRKRCRVLQVLLRDDIYAERHLLDPPIQRHHQLVIQPMKLIQIVLYEGQPHLPLRLGCVLCVGHACAALQSNRFLDSADKVGLQIGRLWIANEALGQILCALEVHGYAPQAIRALCIHVVQHANRHSPFEWALLVVEPDLCSVAGRHTEVCTQLVDAQRKVAAARRQQVERLVLGLIRHDALVLRPHDSDRHAAFPDRPHHVKVRHLNYHKLPQTTTTCCYDGLLLLLTDRGEAQLTLVVFRLLQNPTAAHSNSLLTHTHTHSVSSLSASNKLVASQHAPLHTL
eukprot:m.69764 g.69764  ORF g.69764 m.69764 type:complete len:322 (+) comp14270_c0_seq1:250-1215(+)